MSAQAREALADAINEVPGFNCSPWFRQTTKPGDAVVQWGGARRPDNGFGYINRWEVVVILPQDIAASEKYVAENLPSLLEAASTQMVITNVTPNQLALDTGVVPCVVIEGNREMES
jgi:hypothetical protein